MYRSTFSRPRLSWRWVVSFTFLPFYHQGKSPRYAFDRKLGRPQSRSGRQYRYTDWLLCFIYGNEQCFNIFFFLRIPFYLQAVQIHSANGVKLLTALICALQVTSYMLGCQKLTPWSFAPASHSAYYACSTEPMHYTSTFLRHISYYYPCQLGLIYIYFCFILVVYHNPSMYLYIKSYIFLLSATALYSRTPPLSIRS
jgi:hypothetical protein